MKKNKWFNRERKRGLLFIICFCLPLDSVTKVIDAILPELPEFDRWMFTLFVVAIIALNVGYIVGKIFEQYDEKARKRVIEKEKEEKG